MIKYIHDFTNLFIQRCIGHRSKDKYFIKDHQSKESDNDSNSSFIRDV